MNPSADYEHNESQIWHLIVMAAAEATHATIILLFYDEGSCLPLSIALLASEVTQVIQTNVLNLFFLIELIHAKR